MAITINGTGTISGISAGGLPDGSVTADDLASGAITSGALPSGSVLQVVHGRMTATYAATGTSGNDYWVTPAALTASITPTSTSSKIIIMVQCYVGTGTATSSGYQLQYQILANGSEVTEVNGDEEGGRQGVAGRINDYGTDNQTYHMNMLSGVHQHSPSSTSEQTYTIRFRRYSGDGSVYINRQETYQINSTDYDGVPASTITLMEYA